MAPSATTENTVPIPSTEKIAEAQAKTPAFKNRTLGGAGAAVPAAGEQLPELRTGHREPLKLSGALDKYEHFEVTPIIGREYVDVNLAELLHAPNSDDLLRDLAITSASPPFPSPALILAHHLTNNESIPTRRRLLQKAGRRDQ